MIELTVHNIIKHFGASLILNNIRFQVFGGEKVGIVGENGSGKSTILKLIAGIVPLDRDFRSPPDKGYISITKETSVSYLDQLPVFEDGIKVCHILNSAFEEVYELERQLREIEGSMEQLDGDILEKVLKQYSRLQQSYELKGGYEIDEKMSRVCKGLKFDEAFLMKDFNLLSGGEKTTVLLGKILLESPDILLLDEPSNHLDMESSEWLEGYLKEYKGIVIVVSHDRYFLDNVVTKIIELEDKKCETYEGNYSEYIRQKEENMLLQFEQFKEQQKKINSMEKAIKNLRDWAIRADNNKFFRRASSMQKRLNKMDRIDNPMVQRQSMKLNLKTTGHFGNDVIRVTDLSKAFRDKPILKNTDLRVFHGDRVALIGPNGCGKTTFIKMLLGEETTDSGSIELGSGVRLAYLPQNVSFNNKEISILDCFREERHMLEGKAREYLSKFMFLGSSVFKKVGQLSGGERVRLKLGLLLYEDINLLLLDEPTNHLDIDSIETLEEALDEFKGTIFFISHDRYFINRVCNRIVAVEENKFRCFEGNYDFYKKINEEEASILKEIPPQTPAKKEKVKEPLKADESKKLLERRASLEKSVEELEEQIKELDIKMALASNDYEEVNRLYTIKESLNIELEKAIAEWSKI